MKERKTLNARRKDKTKRRKKEREEGERNEYSEQRTGKE